MLTPEDAAAVLRRAAELDTPSLEQHDVLDESVVRAAAREVGLSDAAVEQAVTEWRAGALAPLPPLPPDRRLGLPGSVAVEGRLARGPAQVAERLDGWLRSQWFERRRTRGNESEWAPRSGPLAVARRAADLDRRIRLRGVGRLRVCVAPAEAGSRVRLVAHVESVRAGLLTGLVGAPAVTTLGVAGAGLALFGGHPMPEVLLAVPAAAGVGGIGWLGASAALQGRLARLEEDLERALELVAAEPVVRRGLPDRAAAWAIERLPRALR